MTEKIGQNTSYTAGATSLSVTIPSNRTSGDLLVLFVMHRSAIATPPTGWTHITTSPATLDTNQQTSAYYKYSAGSETSVSVTQGASGRMALNVSVWRGVPVVTPVVLETDSGTTSSLTLSSGVTTADTLVFGGVSSSLANTGFNTVWSPDTFGPLTTLDMLDNRLFAGVGWVASADTFNATVSANIANSPITGMLIGFEGASEPLTTSMLSQAGVQIGIVGAPTARLLQGAVLVAVTLTPENSPAILDQAAIQMAVRRQHRRLVITTD